MRHKAYFYIDDTHNNIFNKSRGIESIARNNEGIYVVTLKPRYALKEYGVNPIHPGYKIYQAVIHAEALYFSHSEAVNCIAMVLSPTTIGIICTWTDLNGSAFPHADMFINLTIDIPKRSERLTP